MEITNSASSQGTGISGGEGKAPGKGVSTTTSTAKVTITSAPTQAQQKAEQDRHDNEDLKYVRDNLSHTKKMFKQTVERVKNHHK